MEVKEQSVMFPHHRRYPLGNNGLVYFKRVWVFVPININININIHKVRLPVPSKADQPLP
jgi:hypothetical protein